MCGMPKSANANYAVLVMVHGRTNRIEVLLCHSMRRAVTHSDRTGTDSSGGQASKQVHMLVRGASTT